MGLGARARRLVAARGLSRAGVSDGARRGLVWSSPADGFDPAVLSSGARVVTDFTIVKQASAEGDPAEATSVMRAAVGSEVGRVYAWNGEQIGTVRESKRGGTLLDYDWPAGLASCAPG